MVAGGGRGPTVVVVPVVVIVSSIVVEGLGEEGWGKRGVALLCVGKGVWWVETLGEVVCCCGRGWGRQVLMVRT